MKILLAGSVVIATFLAPVVAAMSVLVLLGRMLRLAIFLMFAKEHIIICGLGDVGRALAQDILKNHRDKKFLAIDLDDKNKNINHINQKGGQVLIGDAALKSTLKESRIERASSVILVSGSDVVNLEILSKIQEIFKDTSRKTPTIKTAR